MSDTTDLRERVGAVGASVGSIAAPEYFEFDKFDPANISDAGTRTWIARGQNVTVAYSKAVADDPLERTEQLHEYMVILPFAGASMTVRSNDEQGTVEGPAIAIIPAGDSSIVIDSDAEVVRLFDHRSEDIADAAVNASSYAEPHPHVAILKSWPEPPEGPKLRLYPVGDIPKVEGRFGRMYRSSAFMVNFFYPGRGARPTNRLSPHDHDDFEQIGLVLRGQCTHHIRTPWGKDMADWRDDEHVAVVSPAMVIIPPPTVHTTQSTSPEEYIHFDIFSPPRVDFSSEPGWILNADEYPAPEGVES